MAQRLDGTRLRTTPAAKYRTPSHGHVMHITYLLEAVLPQPSSPRETQQVRINQLAQSARTNTCRVYPKAEDHDENGFE
ncbi:hypothetical protein PENSUB_11887 [Penicillium subrubescens]|uniref:Uncharacterized protein n=1 Tax=Penicillium subrubescens TaxID=1316194 RepID=A0A1Q5T1L1_9EURO|nr:hypothetical protein PENSUB_11887 [Penicillium subrubescens]